MLVENIRLFLKQYWFFVVMLVCVFVAIGIIIYFSTKPTTSNVDNKNIPTPIAERVPAGRNAATLLLPTSLGSNFINAIYVSSFSNTLPTNLPEFTKNKPFYSPQELQALASHFGMSGNLIDIEGTANWSSLDNDSFLSVDTKSGFVSYGSSAVSTNPTDLTSTIASPDEIVPAAQQILDRYGVSKSNTDLNSPTIRYMTSFSEEPSFTDNFVEANFILVSFPRSINNAWLYKQFGETVNTTMVFDKSQNINNLSFYDFETVNQNRKTGLITITQLKENINSGNGTVRQPFNLRGISPLGASFSFTNARAGYLFDSSSIYLVPIFVASGLVTLSDSTQQEAVIYIPAAR